MTKGIRGIGVFGTTTTSHVALSPSSGYRELTAIG